VSCKRGAQVGERGGVVILREKREIACIDTPTHLFIPGPTNVPDAVRRAMNVPMEDMRAPDFGDLTLPLFADLKRVLKTHRDRRGLHLPRLRHRRLGSGDHQHAEPRRQGADGALRPVLDALGRDGRAPRPRGDLIDVANGAPACR
jgi:hypothetical protein